MKTSSLLILVATLALCAGCAGPALQCQIPDPTDSAGSQDEPSRTAQGRKSAAPKEPLPKVVEGAPALEVSERDENCLALNVFYEAGIEHEVGKIAIAHVTLNRLDTGRWGKNICSVVYAESQFSWTSTANLAKPSGPIWDESRKAARNVIKGHRVETLKKALYYHASYVKPYWKDPVSRIQQIGKHVFYSGAKIARSTATK